jgi:hypothetical protein
MRNPARQTRENRTITIDFRDEATYFQLLDNGKAFLECVLAFLLALGLQLKHKTTCGGGGCLTRHSHYVRVRLGGVIIWRLQCTRCKAVFTVLPHFVLRYRQMHPDVARNALLATHGGLSLELCAVLYHISPECSCAHPPHRSRAPVRHGHRGDVAPVTTGGAGRARGRHPEQGDERDRLQGGAALPSRVTRPKVHTGSGSRSATGDGSTPGPSRRGSGRSRLTWSPPAPLCQPRPGARGAATARHDQRLTVRDTLGIPPTAKTRHRRPGRAYPSP